MACEPRPASLAGMWIITQSQAEVVRPIFTQMRNICYYLNCHTIDANPLASLSIWSSTMNKERIAALVIVVVLIVVVVILGTN
jgi:hypothetical protein